MCLEPTPRLCGFVEKGRWVTLFPREPCLFFLFYIRVFFSKINTTFRIIVLLLALCRDVVTIFSSLRGSGVCLYFFISLSFFLGTPLLSFRLLSHTCPSKTFPFYCWNSYTLDSWCCSLCLVWWGRHSAPSSALLSDRPSFWRKDARVGRVLRWYFRWGSEKKTF